MLSRQSHATILVLRGDLQILSEGFSNFGSRGRRSASLLRPLGNACVEPQYRQGRTLCAFRNLFSVVARYWHFADVVYGFSYEGFWVSVELDVSVLLWGLSLGG